MTEAEWSYLAGIIDGEGCISRVKRDLTVQLGITNTKHELTDWIQDRFGGSISVTRKRKNWNEVYQIYWSARKALPILEGVLPYLVIKRTQAEIAIVVIRLLGEHGSNKTDEKNSSLRELLTEELTNLNNRGGN